MILHNMKNMVLINKELNINKCFICIFSVTAYLSKNKKGYLYMQLDFSYVICVQFVPLRRCVVRYFVIYYRLCALEFHLDGNSSIPQVTASTFNICDSTTRSRT